MTVLAKTHMVRTKTKINFIATVDRHTQYLSISSVSVLNVNWSVFVKGILQTLPSHGWNNGTHGGHQLGSGDLGLLPLIMGPTIVSLATVWASWLFMGVLNGGFCHLPPHHPSLSYPISPHHHPTHPLYYQY